MPTNCIYCNKEYKQAAAFKKHLIICDILHSNTTTEELSIRQMSSIISNLIQKSAIQEKKIKALESKLFKKPVKIDIKKWLNKNMNDVGDFEEWFNNFKESIDEKKMDIIYSLGFINGITSLFVSYLNDNCIDQPFKAFTQLPNLFIYKDKEWIILEYDLFKKILFEIQRICLNYLNEYKDSLGNEIFNDRTNALYLHKSSQILCNISEEMEKIYKRIHINIRENARNVIMNDFKIV